MISVSDMFYSFGNMLGDQGDKTFGCYLQALLISYFELSSCFWTVTIAHTLYRVLFVPNTHMADMQKLMPKYHFACWVVPLFLSILPFSTHNMGTSGAWCWISTEENESWGTAWRFVTFYVPLWACIAYNTYVYVLVIRRLRMLTGERIADDEPPTPDGASRPRSESEAARAREERPAVLDRVKYYPLVLTACYFFATINRIVQVSGASVFWLTVLHTMGASSQGTLNAVVYGLTPQVRAAFRTVLDDLRGAVGAPAAKLDQPSELEEFENEFDSEIRSGGIRDSSRPYSDAASGI